MRISEEEELTRVMHEISDAIGATTTILTVHPEDGAEPRALYYDHACIAAATAKSMVDDPNHWPSPDPGEAHRWMRRSVDSSGHDILMMPVQRTAGHSRLVLSALFDQLDEKQRRHAEAVYLARRPFAVGYFRLWQMDRTKQRRIDALETSLDLTDLGVLLLEKSGHVAFCNKAAAALLEKRDGMRRQGLGVAATGLRDGVRLQVAVNHVIDRHSGGKADRRASLLRLERAEGPPLIVSVLPADQPVVETRDIAAIMYVVDPAIEIEQLLQPICKLYGLSPVETRFACLLTKGLTLAEASVEMRVKEQTARGMLKQVFQKTGTNRQAELIRVMFTNLVRTRRIHSMDIL